ncbi:hypothetical protein AB0K00_33135 [Dactylosporangium sp. NPDC049525]|uniref:hypothetical protein n=1 Tax=Dactylosporangium sp. NPDC049525 TaxID=3154730 RepID=UPI0034257855
MADDFARLGADGFEQLSQALALCVFGPGTKVFGDGPDGGREATFDGKVPYPSSAEPWNGYGVVQTKYKARIGTATENATWFLQQVRAEMDAWTDPTKRRVRDGRQPQYLVFITNVPLSSTPGTGGKDKVAALVREYLARLPLLDLAVWDADQCSRLLDLYPELRKAFAGLTTANEVMHELIRQLRERPQPVQVPTSTPARPEFRPGQSGYERPFQQAYDAVGGRRVLGDALDVVQEVGGGVLQHFEGGPLGAAAVICAPFDHPAVVVDHDAWDAWQRIGGSGGGVAAIGYPALDEGQQRFIDTNWTRVRLVGATWGRGTNRVHQGELVRSRDGLPLWRTEVVFDSEASRHADWRTEHGDQAKMDLRLAVAGELPLHPAKLRITEARREQMLLAVAATGLDDLIRQFGTRYGASPSSDAWHEVDDEHRNNARSATYRYLLADQSGRVIVRAGIKIDLPLAYSQVVTVLAEIRIDFDAVQPAAAEGDVVPVPSNLAVQLDELISFFASAWQVSSTALLLAGTDDPSGAEPAGAPRLEFYIQNERPEHSGDPRPRRLLDMVDLTPFGRARTQNTRRLAAGVTTPVGLDPTDVARHAVAALEWIAEDFGFTNPRVPEELHRRAPR